jgi:hypothetical protein
MRVWVVWNNYKGTIPRGLNRIFDSEEAADLYMEKQPHPDTLTKQAFGVHSLATLATERPDLYELTQRPEVA